MFFDYLQKKPEAKKADEEVQTGMRKGQLMPERVERLRDMFTQGDESGLSAEELMREVSKPERRG